MYSKGKILVADEDGLVRWSLAQAFLREGHEVQPAANGKETIELASRHDFDLVIIDLNMPDMEGLEVIKFLQQIHKKFKIIVITAYIAENSARESLEKGASLFMPKPFNLDLMKEVVNRILQAHPVKNQPRPEQSRPDLNRRTA